MSITCCNGLVQRGFTDYNRGESLTEIISNNFSSDYKTVDLKFLL
jgi:hypothetical protein